MKKIALIITIIFSLTSLNISFAQSIEEFDAQLKEEAVSYCYNTLVAAMDVHLIEFQTFLDETFRNKSSNSSLINIAIARFTEYRLALENSFAQIKPGIGYTKLIGDEEDDFEKKGIFQQWQPDAPQNSDQYEICYLKMQEYVENGKKAMIKHIKNNTAQKKTLTILEKYEAINERMRGLNFEIAQMYGYFVTFNQKLNWINVECVK